MSGKNCMLNNDKKNEWTKSYAQQRQAKLSNDIHMIDAKTKRVNCGFVQYGGDRDTGFGHANHTEWI